MSLPLSSEKPKSSSSELPTLSESVASTISSISVGVAYLFLFILMMVSEQRGDLNFKGTLTNL